MSTFAQKVAEQILADATSGSASWDELNGPDAVLRQVGDAKYAVSIPRQYGDDDEPIDHVCVITVECGSPG